MLDMYYRLMNQTKIPREVYPKADADELWSLCEDNQHIMSCHKPGTYIDCTLLDFKAFYPNIMARVKLPYGNVLFNKPKSGEYCTFHYVKQRNGEFVYIWDEMLYMYGNYEIKKTYYMRLTDMYQKLGKEILRRREQRPERKMDFMIFGCFFFGHKQGYKHVENFFAGSYLYVKAFLEMDRMMLELQSRGANILNTATDSILFEGNVNIPESEYKYSLRHFTTVEYRSQNNWTGYEGDVAVVDKRQSDVRNEDN